VYIIDKHTGIMKASVFPEPVFAAPRMSFPFRARLIDSLCMSVGTLYLLT